MEKLILDSFDFSVCEDDFFRAVKLSREDDPELADEAAEVLSDCLKTARPRAVCVCAPVSVHENTVTIGNAVFENEFVAEKLSECGICVPYIGTCGREAEAWSKTLSDPLHCCWADEIKLMLFKKAMMCLRSEVKSRWFPAAEHLNVLNPGSLKHWPLEGQRDLFAVLDGGAEEIGVELTPSLLMLPAKSSSGIFFSSSKEYENCELCPRTDCPNRRAGFCGNTDWRSR